MPVIHLKTKISSDIGVVFDLARSIDLHKISAAHTNEEAIAGRMSGLIEYDETVTWQAKHFGVRQKLKVKISALERPNYFVDEMITGAFKSFKHQHVFTVVDEQVVMEDIFDYVAPLGFLGRLADWVFLKKYMTHFLHNRNQVIKAFAESERWKEVL